MSKSEQAPSPYPINPKLKTILALDYPDATEILLPFADELELVGSIKRAATTRQPETTLYIGAYEKEQERPIRDHFFGLSEEINLATSTYRQYKLYLPWPQPTIYVEFAEGAEVGKVVGQGSMRLAMHEIGQAQVWHGLEVGVIWECYAHEQRRPHNWQEELAQFWSVVEGNIADPAIPASGEGPAQPSNPSKPYTFYTQPHDPAFEEGYQEFLQAIGYTPDPEHPK